MKSALYPVACASIMLVVIAACATSGDEEPAGPPTGPVEGGTVIPDDASVADAVPIDDAAPPTCSEAGWCATDLPIPDLTLVDVWPLATHAFAVAATEPPGFQDEHSGAKVLEWDGARWSAIDDGTQNDIAISPTTIWAPSDDEVYYAVTDMSRSLLGEGSYGGYVYHGLRAVAPATGWTWTRDRIDCGAFDTPKVWGTSKDDVYVLSCKAIRHLGSVTDAGVDPDASDASDADAPDADTSPWGVVYVDDSGTNDFSGFVGATGTSRDDAWFIGSRGVCAVLVHETSAGYQRVADSTQSGVVCQDKAGYLNVQGGFFLGAEASAKDRLLGIRTKFLAQGGTAQDVARIAADGDGGYAVDFSRPTLPPLSLTSVWAAADTPIWLSGTCGSSGGGCVLEGDDLWSDAGAYQFSTLAIRGAPNTHALSRIRGTSNTNLWAVGDDRAFHKTTP
jgi:hypothetical protein